MALRSPGPQPRVRAVVTPSCGTTSARCEIGDALRLASKAHVLDVLHLLAERPARFNELRAATRVNQNVLARRLRDLAAEGLVERRVLGEAPARVEYATTPEGRALLEAIGPLRAWASQRAGRAAPTSEATDPRPRATAGS